MGELAEAGCVAFSHADAPLTDTQVLLPRDAVCGDVRPPRLAAPAGRRISARAASRTTARSRRGSALPAIPASAETIALATIFALVRETGVRVHLCRLSTRRGRRDGARREEASGLAGHLRRRRPSPASVRRRHRLVRRAMPSRAAAAQHARPRGAARRARRRHHRPRLLRSHAGRRRRQAAAVRRGRAGRDRSRTPAAADAQMGGRRKVSAGRGARADHRRTGGASSGSTRAISPRAAPPTSASSIRERTGRSSARR